VLFNELVDASGNLFPPASYLPEDCMNRVLKAGPQPAPAEIPSEIFLERVLEAPIKSVRRYLLYRTVALEVLEGEPWIRSSSASRIRGRECSRCEIRTRRVVEERIFRAAFAVSNDPPFRACGGLKPALKIETPLRGPEGPLFHVNAK
jgi:hypothetical protein